MPRDVTREGRAERRRANRLRAIAAKGGARPRPVTGPVEIPSEARMMRNLEREWGEALPGEMGRTHDAPAQHPPVPDD